jgi:soluble lytic murein transglycosylase-like protein
MAGKPRMNRWWSEYNRARNDARMHSYEHQLHQQQRRLALLGLAIIVGWFALIIALLICTPAKASPVDQTPTAAKPYKLTLKREAQRVWGLTAPVPVFAAQIHQESRWRPDATSPVGAVGLAQFMPATAKWIGQVDPGLAQGVAMSRNPTWAIRALVTYDHWLYQRIKADTECQRMAYALSAYNGGLGWVYKRQRLSHRPGQCLGLTCAINPGITPANQTENLHYPQVILIKHQRTYTSWGRNLCL